jgi:UDPglucose 6-dehydrogenase/GDP-mannose 6-dehydrogenase
MVMKVSVVGTGYVGLVSGACLAEKGHRVVCVDIDAAKVAAVNAGQCPIHEEGLPAIIARHAGGRLTATTDLAAAVRETDLTLIAAPTPFDGERIDLSYVREVARAIGTALRDKPGYHVVVVKSTVVPGTTDDVVGPAVSEASGRAAGDGFGLGMNPEFLSEGVAVSDFMNPDRIVVGGIDERTRDAMAALYAGFPGVPMLRTGNKAAEMIKYASNALQATMISFANEIADLCERIDGVDAIEVMRGVHAMKELTVASGGGAQPVAAPIVHFLSPGCGFGGSCFPKDLKAIVAHGKTLGAPTPLLDAVVAVNADRPARMVDLAETALGGLAGKRVALLGLAFKPGTDDMRESPAVPIARELRRRGADVVAYDPAAIAEARKLFGAEGPAFASSTQEAIRGADAVLLVTRWAEFADLPKLIAEEATKPVVIDGRRMIAPGSVPRYRGIGRREGAGT